MGVQLPNHPLALVFWMGTTCYRLEGFSAKPDTATQLAFHKGTRILGPGHIRRAGRFIRGGICGNICSRDPLREKESKVRKATRGITSNPEPGNCTAGLKASHNPQSNKPPERPQRHLRAGRRFPLGPGNACRDTVQTLVHPSTVNSQPQQN